MDDMEDMDEMAEWTCAQCTYNNPRTSAICEICGSSQDEKVWKCVMCTMANAEGMGNCIVCGAPRADDRYDFIVNGDASALDSTIWECPVCNFKNPTEVNTCALCTYANEGNETGREQKGDGNELAEAGDNDDAPSGYAKLVPMLETAGNADGESGNAPYNTNDPSSSQLEVPKPTREVDIDELKMQLEEIVEKAPTAKLAVGVLKSLKKVTSRISDDDGHFRILDTRAKAVQSKLLEFEGVTKYLEMIGFKMDYMGFTLQCFEYPAQDVLDYLCEFIQGLMDEQRKTYNPGYYEQKEKEKPAKKGNALLEPANGRRGHGHAEAEAASAEKEFRAKEAEIRKKLEQKNEECMRLHNKICDLNLELKEKDGYLQAKEDKLERVERQLRDLQSEVDSVRKEKITLVNSVTEQMNTMRKYLHNYQRIAAQVPK